MKVFLDNPGEEVQIQIIPLIDVIFCILTFFILAALQLTRPQGIEIELPQASTGSPQVRQMLVVTVTDAGLILLNQDPTPVDRLQLIEALRRYNEQNPEGIFVLNASRRAMYDDVAQILDLMRLVGGDRVALSTVPAEEGQPAPTPTSSPFPGSSPLPTFDPNNPYTLPGQPGGGLSPSPTLVPGIPGGTTPTMPTTPTTPTAPNDE